MTDKVICSQYKVGQPMVCTQALERLGQLLDSVNIGWENNNSSTTQTYQEVIDEQTPNDQPNAAKVTFRRPATIFSDPNSTQAINNDISQTASKCNEHQPDKRKPRRK
jgi:hypothetical protein